jgi:TetR/AcrR family transcriptional regulator, transcriptional repressor for nem operon
MLKNNTKNRQPAVTRKKLIQAALTLMLRQGFASTTVDQICAEAQLTKGSFFHYFPSKEAIGQAALDDFAMAGTQLYSAAWEDPQLDPLQQLHRIFDIMISFNQSRTQPCVCMVGMMSQELSRTNATMRKSCEKHLTHWNKMVTKMLTAAKKLHPPRIDFDPTQVAWFLNSLWQGSMLIGKTRQTPKMIIQNLQMARNYVDELFSRPASPFLSHPHLT